MGGGASKKYIFLKSGVFCSGPGRKHGVFWTGVTTNVIAGISEPFDYPPCLNDKVSFSALKAITIHPPPPPNKNFLAVSDDISDRNIQGSSQEMQMILQTPHDK